jgi:NADP-reducing hydrogenase subunit HndB
MVPMQGGENPFGIDIKTKHMTKIKNLADLRKLKDQLQSKERSGERGRQSDDLVQVKIAMATCSIASGSKETLNYLVDELEKRNIDAVVTQTGCMGYCYAEPTVEVTLPGQEPVVFGFLNIKKADAIIEKYIKNGELIEGIIPVNYETIHSNV